MENLFFSCTRVLNTVPVVRCMFSRVMDKISSAQRHISCTCEFLIGCIYVRLWFTVRIFDAILLHAHMSPSCLRLYVYKKHLCLLGGIKPAKHTYFKTSRGPRTGPNLTCQIKCLPRKRDKAKRCNHVSVTYKELTTFLLYQLCWVSSSLMLPVGDNIWCISLNCGWAMVH